MYELKYIDCTTCVRYFPYATTRLVWFYFRRSLPDDLTAPLSDLDGASIISLTLACFPDELDSNHQTTVSNVSDHNIVFHCLFNYFSSIAKCCAPLHNLFVTKKAMQTYISALFDISIN